MNTPPIDLLQPPGSHVEDPSHWIATTQGLILHGLREFGVLVIAGAVTSDGEMTRFEVRPVSGARVEPIHEFQLRRFLFTEDLRALPQPDGRVFIELPTRKTNKVPLRELLQSARCEEMQIPLPVGKNAAGEPVLEELDNLRHLLVHQRAQPDHGGYIHALVAAMLCRCNPAQMQFLLIAPDSSELQVYSELPHLVSPVVTDPEKALASLSWAVDEKERRFAMLEAGGFDDVNAFNSASGEPLPRLVVVISELAGLMTRKDDADQENAIILLARDGAKAGIHLIVATQVPTPNVVTGIIKAYIPSRIAFRTEDASGSLFMLDEPGAERLVDGGDLLYHGAGNSRLARLQGPDVTTGELERLVRFYSSGRET